MKYHHGPLRIAIFNDPMFYENGMIVWLEGGDECWIIDPGLPPQPTQMAAAIQRQGLARRTIVLTHAHADHIAGITPLQKALNDAVPVLCPANEVELLTSAEANLSALMGAAVTGPAPTRVLHPGDTLDFAGAEWRCLDVSGHSPGGMAYYCSQFNIALVGDALFAEGIGRYDFPHSSRANLLRNIQQNLLSLPDQTTIYPGHGEPATLADIKVRNVTLLSELSR